MKDSQVGEILEIASPIIKKLAGKIFGDGEDEDDEEEENEGNEGKPSEPSNEGTLQEQTKEQTTVPALDEKDDTLTGGASEIEQDISGKKDVPKMTKEAEMQEMKIRACPPELTKEYPEREYYKLSFILKDSRDGKNIPDWIKNNNEVLKVKDIKNEKLQTLVIDKVKKAALAENDTRTLKNIKDIYTVAVKPNSKLTNMILQSSDLRNELKIHMDDIKLGKYVNKSMSFTFKESNFNDIGTAKKIKISTHNTINLCDLYNIKYEKNGDITFTIVDYYDFADSDNMIVKNAYLQQKNGRLEPYVLIVPIRIKL